MQNTGVSPAFLADIKPQTDGANGLKYNLTADIIESIFKTYPMVKKKHAESVPHSLSESEFWTHFFQSHYFHRDRINIVSKDIFSECAKHDEEEIRAEISQKVTNPLLDLTEIKDTGAQDEYRGIGDDNRTSTNITNQSLIRRFNHHSTMVLRACQGEQAASTSGTNENGSSSKIDGYEPKGPASRSAVVENGRLSKTNGSSGGGGSSSSRPAEDEPLQKKARLHAVMEIEDLSKQESMPGVGLRLERMERYLHGPTPASASRYTTSDDVMRAFHTVSGQMHSWHPNPSTVSTTTNS
ncbi:hypothetical protein V1264_003080 [Littorina saxatilis]|uniref:BSD domain-containing protein n=1 Tax=Littorina saxatilis TaxID=31220 RepID=A0AAN9B477_9CAEN